MQVRAALGHLQPHRTTVTTGRHSYRSPEVGPVQSADRPQADLEMRTGRGGRVVPSRAERSRAEPAGARYARPATFEPAYPTDRYQLVKGCISG